MKGLEKVTLNSALRFYHDLAKRNDHEINEDFAKSISTSLITAMQDLKLTKYDSCLILKNTILVMAMTEVEALMKDKIDNESEKMRNEMK